MSVAMMVSIAKHALNFSNPLVFDSYFGVESPSNRIRSPEQSKEPAINIKKNPIAVLDGIPVYPIFGSAAGQYGITHSGDLLVSRLRDGTDLNEIWEDAVAALAEFNKTAFPS